MTSRILPSGLPARLRAGLLAALLGLLLAGCASAPPVLPPVAPLFDDAAFAPPSRRIDAADVMAVTPAMRQFLRDRLLPRARSSSSNQSLLDALYTNSALKLAYDTEMTRTASEAFDARAGNCLSLVLMTAAFAGELGLPVRFQSALSEESWARDGDLVLIVGHVNVAIGRPSSPLRSLNNTPDWLTVDFLPGVDLSRQRAVAIEPARVLSMYMNNKAAEALARGQVADAYWWARAAVEQDPGFAAAFNTLGVVYLRHGLPQRAEAALRHMLALEADSPHGLGNLAQVLRRLGREAEATEMAQRAERSAPASPFAAFDLGRQALERGALAQARRHFEHAVRLGGHYHEFHLALAQVLARQGDAPAAARELEAAREAASTPRLQALYSGKLERLREQLEPAAAAAAPPGRRW